MFSKTCNYAIRATLFLAVHTDEENKIGVDEIAAGLKLPKHFLAKILQRLTRHNLASSSKGRNGGFYLSEKNKDAPLLRIVESIDGPDLFSSCILGLSTCSGKNPCTLHAEAVKYRESMLSIIEHDSIRDTANKISRKKLKI